MRQFDNNYYETVRQYKTNTTKQTPVVWGRQHMSIRVSAGPTL